MLDLEALSSAEMQTTPFRWAQIRGMLSAPDSEALSAAWPGEDFWAVEGKAQQSYSYAIRPLTVLGRGPATGLSPLPQEWAEVLEDLLSPQYKESLSRLAGIDLRDAELEASLRRWDRGAHLGPHRDNPDKLLTHIVYFERDWAAERGGCLRILGSENEEDVVAEIPPHLGTSSLLVRSERSWHSVTPVAATSRQPRRSLQMTWMPRGSVSPAWKLRDNGSLEIRREPKRLSRLRGRVHRARRKLL